MIKNQRQHQQALKQAAHFRSAISDFKVEECPENVDPVMYAALLSGMKSQLHSIDRDISEFEELRAGNVDVIKLSGLEMLPLGLIKARIARGMSQKELAGHLGVKAQQVQRWEHEEYENVGFARLKEISSVLRLNINEIIFLNSGNTDHVEDGCCITDASTARVVKPINIPLARGFQISFEVTKSFGAWVCSQLYYKSSVLSRDVALGSRAPWNLDDAYIKPCLSA